MVTIYTLNERYFHLQSDIALVMFSVLLAAVIRFAGELGNRTLNTFSDHIGEFGFEGYLMEGVLCFMLFAGASKVNLKKFRQNVRAISLLALLATMLSALVYGILFFAVSSIFNMEMDLVTCVLLGCVVAPTDPIAATGILGKIGLSKNVCSVIENESLFNDGTGVTLFIFVRSLLIHAGDSNFFILIAKEIGGAVVVAFLISFLLFKLFSLTKTPMIYILVSLLDVALVYVICEELGFSGVIASVVCGMYFSGEYEKMSRRAAAVDPERLYINFWDVLEYLLNGVLFVMIGLMALNLDISRYELSIIPAAILINILARALGVFVAGMLTGKNNLPGNYNIQEYISLLTWSALKGGLSLALAIGTKEYLSPDVYDIFMNVTFTTIFFTVLVQGMSVKRVYYAVEKHKAERIKLSNGSRA